MASAPSQILERHIDAVRAFNRFYTQHIGVLRDGWLESPFSLTQARVLYEIGQRQPVTATEIGRELQLDAGYLSRIVQRFHKAGLVRKEASPSDGRQSLLSMTAKGRRAFAPLETRTIQQVGQALQKLSPSQQGRLVTSLDTARNLLGGARNAARKAILRQPRPGDLGWIVARHAAIYAEEYDWAGEFEGLCAQIVADFSKSFDPSCERCWIAELDGENVGSVFLVKDSDGVARLRLLLVEPSARGLGIGRALTEECVRFARDRGYRRITLWTHQNLTAARHIYANAGFTLTSSEAKRSFGQDVVSEHWDLTL
jgi:DNA-binding MarR family transcriptional regulator/GNAT superfamily N-acetyltransferase